MADSAKTVLDAEEAIANLLATLEQLREKTARHSDAAGAHGEATDSLLIAANSLDEVAQTLQGCALSSKDVLNTIRESGAPAIVKRLDQLASALGDSGKLVESIRVVVSQSVKEQRDCESRTTEFLTELRQSVKDLQGLPSTIRNSLEETMEDVREQQLLGVKQSREAIDKGLLDVVGQLKTIGQVSWLALFASGITAAASIWVASQMAG